MSFIQDYLDGTYPSFQIDLFISDLAFSIINALNEKAITRIRLTPLLYDSELFRPLEATLRQVINPDVLIEKDELVSPDDLWAYDVTPGKFDFEYEEFLKYISGHKDVECSREDFRLIKLFTLYGKFASH